jgi:xylitol oxidase
VPSSGEELQSEYLIPRAFARDALAALHLARHEIAPVLQICELRTVAGDAQWLSPAYQRDSLALHFTWTQHPGVDAAMSAIEGRLAALQPRPHWGKLFTYPPQEVAARYPRLGDFQALVADYDPTHKFRNAAVDPYLDATFGGNRRG